MAARCEGRSVKIRPPTRCAPARSKFAGETGTPTYCSRPRTSPALCASCGNGCRCSSTNSASRSSAAIPARTVGGRLRPVRRAAPGNRDRRRRRERHERPPRGESRPAARSSAPSLRPARVRPRLRCRSVREARWAPTSGRLASGTRASPAAAGLLRDRSRTRRRVRRARSASPRRARRRDTTRACANDRDTPGSSCRAPLSRAVVGQTGRRMGHPACSPGRSSPFTIPRASAWL